MVDNILTTERYEWDTAFKKSEMEKGCHRCCYNNMRKMAKMIVYTIIINKRTKRKEEQTLG